MIKSKLWKYEDITIIDKKKYSDIYFFGDKCIPEGNDYPLYIYPGINGISVKNPEETLYILKKNFS